MVRERGPPVSPTGPRFNKAPVWATLLLKVASAPRVTLEKLTLSLVLMTWLLPLIVRPPSRDLPVVEATIESVPEAVVVWMLLPKSVVPLRVASVSVVPGPIVIGRAVPEPLRRALAVLAVRLPKDGVERPISSSMSVLSWPITIGPLPRA